MKSNSDNQTPIIFGSQAYLPGAKAVVTFAQGKGGQFNPPDAEPVPVPTKSDKKYIPWGNDDNYPVIIQNVVSKTPTLARNLRTNIQMLYGQGIQPIKKVIDPTNPDKGFTTQPCTDQKILDWFEDNDINGWFLEQCTDMSYYSVVVPELILNEKGDYITDLNHLEAAHHRLEEPNLKKIINNIYYCGKFGTDSNIENDDVNTIKLIPNKYAVNYILEATGKLTSKSKDTKIRQFAMQVKVPSPGRVFYPKPDWSSVIESGWLEFANSIPEFKKYLMKNQIALKYQIVIDEGYFPKIFDIKGITDPKKRKAYIDEEFKRMNEFLTDVKNAGKAHVTYAKNHHGRNGHELVEMIKFVPIKHDNLGGEYIQDSEEVGNIISFAVGQHPQLAGATPGKGGTISGTEARELYNIKKTLLFPERWQILKILYTIKKFNKWDKDLYFAIADPLLTTLDKDKTGVSQKLTIF